jgi:hypothetical protein
MELNKLNKWRKNEDSLPPLLYPNRIPTWNTTRRTNTLMNKEALKDWGRILILIGAYLGGFILLLAFVLWLKTLIN